jgi:hypothetical protein
MERNFFIGADPSGVRARPMPTSSSATPQMDNCQAAVFVLSDSRVNVWLANAASVLIWIKARVGMQRSL